MRSTNTGGLPCLETREFLAFIIDNSPAGIHRRGYNGVASLIPRRWGNNLLVPFYAGLNYETIWLAGLPPYRSSEGLPFEPRCEPMEIESADAERVVLVQPETSYSHVSARIEFRVQEPHYLHQRIELVFHRRFCPEGEPNWFRSLWASYIHMPPDRHIYMRSDWRAGDPLSGWFGVTKAEHTETRLEVRLLPDGRELSPEEHLSAMQGAPPLSDAQLAALPGERWPPSGLPRSQEGPLAFYYGLCHGEELFLMMFKQPERFRLAYSPNGGGRQPAWSPAWDYVLWLPDAPLETVCTWDLCLAVKPYAGRADVIDEVRRYMGG